MSIFENLFNDNKNKEILGLTDEAKAIYINNYFKSHDDNITIVTNTLYEANILYQSLINYNDDVLLFPMDDFLTSEALATSPEFKVNRLEVLSTLLNKDKKIVITNLMGFLRFLPTKENYLNSYINLKVNQNIKMDDLIKLLFKIGYRREAIINKTGEIAVRGYVIDIFPLNEENPIRIEYWGDEIESIKIFDVNTQLTIKAISNIIITPNTEFIVNIDVPFEEQKQKYLEKYTKVTNIGNFSNSVVIYNDYSNLCISYKNLLNEITDYNINLNISADTRYMFELSEIKSKDFFYFQNFDNVINKKDYIKYETRKLDDLGSNEEEINKTLNKLIKDKTVIICLTTNNKVSKLDNSLNNNNVVITNEETIFDNKINIIVKRIYKGFIYNKYIFISESDIYGKTDSNYKYKTNFKIGTKIKDISKLNIGDYVVHSLYGIGKYCGIKTLEKNTLKKDYLYIEYKDNDKLYIPVEKIDLLHKYSSAEGSVPKINRLNSAEWVKTKAKVKKKIEDITLELLKLYAEREKAIGFAFDKDNEMQRNFENNFIYEETKDQIKVINEIKKDMESIHPMDRLLCGDVGYGKTEVAFRAIFKAILSGKQVALLCPTTILSNQHYQNAIERFKDFPVKIGLLNRFVSGSNATQIISNLKDGKIDLIIGTHRILSNDIEFKNLGLLVIDEEQRFGVKHKERIKEYKNNIDVLTLSATPIPRTLQMSMSGIRSLSLIETPPVDRFPIQTYVLSLNNQIIKDAIYKELSRNGQIFILYNRISDMDEKKLELEQLVPGVKIITAHGKMNKTEIEDVMQKFIDKEYDVLLCTTIIETGIDIQNANTLIIMDADNFGLSQLYQIRGRVGRSNKIAYCYLMYKKDKSLNETAIKRLDAIKEFTELGSGFSIAMRDLSIRGAGDILGSEQAGFVDSVGIELFMEMLNDEINRQKGILKEEEKEKPLIEVSTFIDNKIAMEEELKIEIHRKINEINSKEKLEQVKNELIDRFGKINEDIEIYMYEELFERMANELNISNVRQNKTEIEIMLPEEIFKQIKVTELFINVTNISRNFKFAMRGSHLIITLLLNRLDNHFVYYLIDLLELIKTAIQ